MKRPGWDTDCQVVDVFDTDIVDRSPTLMFDHEVVHIFLVRGAAARR